MNIRHIFFSLSLMTAGVAQATLSIEGTPTGVSGFYYPAAETNEKPTIYGGYVASSTSTCIADTENTCNTCDGTHTNKMVPCNMASINPNLKIRLNLISTTTFTSGASVVLKNASGNVITFSSTPVINGAGISILTTWSEICTKLNNSACSNNGSFNQSLTVGVDTSGGTNPSESITINFLYSGISADDTDLQYYENCPTAEPSDVSKNYGYCYVKFERGDEKVYADQQSTPSTYPVTPRSDIKYSALVFFYAKAASDSPADKAAALASLTNGSDYFSISVNNAVTPPTVNDNRINGLENDSTYCFLMANQDATGNIYYATPPPGVGTPATTVDELCTTPSKVVGLLDDKNCFIATAAFGSGMAPEVNEFRHFRNEFLLTNSWGRQFVSTYYHLSPPVADFIAQSEILRWGARLGLWPLLLIAKVFVHVGTAAGLMLLTLLGSATVFCAWHLRQRRSRRKARIG